MSAERLDPTLACEQYDRGETVQLDEGVQPVYDVQRLLDQYEALRATLWRISRRAESGLAADGDKILALIEIETWADETLQETPWIDDPSPAEQPAATRHDDPDRRPDACDADLS